MELVGQMYKLSACFDTPNEYKGLPYDYFPDDAVSYGSTICSFGLPYNDHNYGMPTGLTPPVMAPHLMDPVCKPKRVVNDLFAKAATAAAAAAKIEPSTDNDMIAAGGGAGGGGFTVSNGASNCAAASSTAAPLSPSADPLLSSNCTPRKQYLDENDYPVYVEPEIKVVEVPDNLCVSASEYSDCSSESSDDTKVSVEFLVYLRSLGSKHESIERYLNRAQRHFSQYAHSQKSSGSEKRDCSLTSDAVIDCICEYSYDDKRMVQCESCGVKQHLDCMYVNPRLVQNFLKHRCQKCSDIKVDINRAKAIQNSRKNWHLGNQGGDKSTQKCKMKGDDKKHRDFLVKFRDTKNEQTVNDKSLSGKNNANMIRVNKRKQDLKVYGEQDSASIPPSVKLANDDSEESSVNNPKGLTINQDASVLSPIAMEPQEPPEAELKPDLSVPSTELSEEVLGKATDSTEYQHVLEEYPDRLSIMNRRNPPFKKDYKEATKSLYTSALLRKIDDMKESEEEKQNMLANANVEGLEQGTEFLDRNPRCRIVLFDGCTMGLEASVRLQSCSIVSAMIGRMMLMEEYLKYASPTTEYRPFVFLYHGFGDHGLVIDTTVYGNISRYLRRSCDPNVKLEHTIIGGLLYVVIRTTTEICQGVELTIPFDLPFEICQYPVQCACGKVRCPAIKHRRKHHRNRIITSNINCEQVIEDKLRELSQPLCSSTNSYAANVTGLKKPIIPNRFGIQSRQMMDSYNDNIAEAKPSLSSLHNDNRSVSDHNSIIAEDRIKREEREPSPVEEPDYQSPQSKHISSNLSGSAILTTKRRPKPVQHPDFEVEINSRISDRSRSRSNNNSSNHTTPIKPKTEPVIKRVSDNPNLKSPSHKSNNNNNSSKETSTFKSIITTRQQKLNKSPHANKRARSSKSEAFDDEIATKRSSRSKKPH